MKLIRTENAEGMILCHDMTQIIPGVSKDARFRKGHVVTKEDIPVLLSMGKENLYVYEKTPGMLHEDEAAVRLYHIATGEMPSGGEGAADDLKGESSKSIKEAAATSNIYPSETIKEGKIQAYAAIDGLFTVDTERLLKVNSIPEIMIATRHGRFPVKKGDSLAGMRVIPLVVDEEKIKRAEEIYDGKPLLSVKPFTVRTACIVTTGSEVYNGLIEDAFGPAIRKKLEEYNVDVLDQMICNDDPAMITSAILKAAEETGADMVLCTGGMSVDPDDRTPSAIRDTGAEIVTYGSPVLPGAMFLLSYYRTKDGRSVPVMGLPGCVMYNKRTVFDLMLPQILAGIRPSKEDIASLGEGGLCLNCEVCTFPNCGFGK